MAIQSFQLDPNAASYTDDQIVDKVNAASNDITRAGSVSAAARPIESGEAAANLDAMTDTARGYIKTSPAVGEFPVVSIQRDASGLLDTDYDDVPIV